MNLLPTELLNLPGVMVEDFRQTEKELFLEVEVYAAEATCSRCGNISSHPHQNHWLRVRDLPMSNRAVWLKVNRRQFKCTTGLEICLSPVRPVYPIATMIEQAGKLRSHGCKYIS